MNRCFFISGIFIAAVFLNFELAAQIRTNAMDRLSGDPVVSKMLATQCVTRTAKGTIVQERLKGFASYGVVMPGYIPRLIDSAFFAFRADSQRTLLNNFQLSSYKDFLFYPSTPVVPPSALVEMAGYYLHEPTVLYDSGSYTQYIGPSFQTTLLARDYTNGKIMEQREKTSLGTNVCIFRYDSAGRMNYCRYRPHGNPTGHSFFYFREFDSLSRVKKDSAWVTYYRWTFTDYQYGANNNLQESKTRSGFNNPVPSLRTVTYAYSNNNTLVARKDIITPFNMYTLDSFWYRGGKLSIVRNYNMADTTLQNWRLSRAEFYHYNLVGNIDSIVTQNPAGNVISRSIYTYTNFDHIKAAHYYDGISNQPAGEDRFYYEVIGQTAVAPYTQRKMTFFPNPVTDQLSINTGNTAGKSLRFTIHNLQGQQLSEIITSDSNPVINVVFLPVGTYILEVKGNDIAERLRFVKMR